MSRRVVVMGNSGAGKSTLAQKMAREEGLAHLDLDTLAWLPDPPPRRAPLADSVARMDAFFAENPDWVVEGCYADLLAEAARRATLLVFLDPGVEACIANCRARPWEPHKYRTREEQDANLELLIQWVRAYDTRTDEFSRRAHENLFASFPGEKHRPTSPST